MASDFIPRELTTMAATTDLQQVITMTTQASPHHANK